MSDPAFPLRAVPVSDPPSPLRAVPVSDPASPLRAAGPRRLSAAESMGDLGSGRHGRSVHHAAGDADSPLFTPPGTPPPPYGGSTCDMASATAASDWDRFDHEVGPPRPTGTAVEWWGEAAGRQGFLWEIWQQLGRKFKVPLKYCGKKFLITKVRRFELKLALCCVGIR